MLELGLGAGWRQALAMHIERRKDLGFIEILADNHFLDSDVIPPIVHLQSRGVKVVVHSVSLSLGSASLPDPGLLESINALIDLYGAVLFSEHLAFVRGGGLEAGHLLPVKRTEESLKVIVDNINFASSKLSVPLVLENIASFVEWPGSTMPEDQFLSKIVENTDCQLLLDLSNLYANSVNLGFDALQYLENLPLHKIGYMHVAGGSRRNGIYHDTHAHALDQSTLAFIKKALGYIDNRSVLLERDDNYPSQREYFEELDSLLEAMKVTKPVFNSGEAKRIVHV